MSDEVKGEVDPKQPADKVVLLPIALLEAAKVPWEDYLYDYGQQMLEVFCNAPTDSKQLDALFAAGVKTVVWHPTYADKKLGLDDPNRSEHKAPK